MKRLINLTIAISFLLLCSCGNSVNNNNTDEEHQPVRKTDFIRPHVNDIDIMTLYYSAGDGFSLFTFTIDEPPFDTLRSVLYIDDDYVVNGYGGKYSLDRKLFNELCNVLFAFYEKGQFTKHELCHWVNAYYINNDKHEIEQALSNKDMSYIFSQFKRHIEQTQNITGDKAKLLDFLNNWKEILETEKTIQCI